MNMQLEKPMKQIVYLFNNSLSEKRINKLMSLITKEDANREIKVTFEEDNKECNVETVNVEALERIFQTIKVFLRKEKIVFSCLLTIEMKVTFCDGDALKFMNGFFKDPHQNGQSLCMSTRFICREDDISEMVLLEISEHNEVNIEGTMFIDDDGIINAYNKGISLLHKVIKY